MTAHGRPSPAEFQVLLALVDGPKHGIAIRADVADRTSGAVDMGPGTLYGAIKRLLRSGWIDEVGDDTASSDGRRRYYAPTGDGLAVAREEARRMAALLEIAVDKSLMEG